MTRILVACEESQVVTVLSESVCGVIGSDSAREESVIRLNPPTLSAGLRGPIGHAGEGGSHADA